MVRAGRCVLVLGTVTTLGAGVFALAGSGAVQAAPAMARAGSAGNVPAIAGQLNGVSADSAADAWAVGFAETNPNPRNPLIVRWNGTAWSQVPSPSLAMGSDGAVLNSVSALSPADAWAVGFISAPSNNFPNTLILHWNGTAWSRVPGPDPDGSTTLNSVSAVSPTDIWAVGSYFTAAKVPKPLILHWNGTAWSQVHSPSPGVGVTSITGVSAVSHRNAWAVGTYSGSTAPFKSLTLHWNGAAWSHVKTPTPPHDFAQLTGVSTVSGTDAWAVGLGYGPANMTLHWNGTAWSQVSIPSPGTASKQLTGVSADSATDAWAVGWGRQNTMFEPFFTVTFHWNGTVWSRVPSPNPGNGGGQGASQLFAVTTLSPANAWAVGTAGLILIEHWNGTRWSA